MPRARRFRSAGHASASRSSDMRSRPGTTNSCVRAQSVQEWYPPQACLLGLVAWFRQHSWTGLV